MVHEDYPKHLSAHPGAYINDNLFCAQLQNHLKEFLILVQLNLDPAVQILESLYSPNEGASPRDPTCMLRFLILMTLTKEPGITRWVQTMRSLDLWAVLAGFEPGDTPGVETYYDFIKRLIDDPYQKPCQHLLRRTTFNAGGHRRNLKREKELRKQDQPCGQSQSAQLVSELLPRVHELRPRDFQAILFFLISPFFPNFSFKTESPTPFGGFRPRPLPFAGSRNLIPRILYINTSRRHGKLNQNRRFLFKCPR